MELENLEARRESKDCYYSIRPGVEVRLLELSYVCYVEPSQVQTLSDNFR